MIKYKLALVQDGEMEYGVVNSAMHVHDIAHKLIGDEAQEVLGMFTLNAKNQVIGYFEIGRGALDMCVVSPFEVVKRMVMSNCQKMVLVHNHPSGDPTPSKADLESTRMVYMAMEVLGCNLIDHVIISANGRYISIRDLVPKIFE